MKKLFSLFLLLLIPFAASAVKVDGIYYTFFSDSKTAVVSYSMWNDQYSGDIVIPETVTYEDIVYSVTDIGESAFSKCEKMTSVTIPNSVTAIANSAFNECTGLKSITIPNSVTTIGEWAFHRCTNLVSVKLSDNLTSLGHGAFWQCFSLTTVNIPGSLSTIEKEAFGYCSSLTELTIPEGTTLIGEYAFRNNTSLTTVTFPKSIATISMYAFGECDALTDIYCYAEVVPNIDGAPFFFEIHQNAILHVPAAYVTDYRYGWNFANVVPIEEDEEEDEEIDYDLIIINETGKGTWCSDYDLDFTDVEGIKAYTATGYVDKDKTIWLTRVFNVPAGTGIMVKGNPGEYKVPHSPITAAYANFFKGVTGSSVTINETDGDYSNYYMAGGQFKKVNGSVTIKPNRAYLQLPTLVFAGTRTIEVIYGDEEDYTTGIHSAAITSDQEPAIYYNLHGQRVNNPRKGLYIINGKKYVIK